VDDLVGTKGLVFGLCRGEVGEMRRKIHDRSSAGDHTGELKSSDAETTFDPTSVPILHPEVIDALLQAFYGDFGKGSGGGTFSA
jgi:hypothetical protein